MIGKDQEKLMAKVQVLLKQKGQKAFHISRKSVLQEKYGEGPVAEAIRYFMDNWRDVHHPALLALACEAVGGNPDVTTQVGAATVLLASAADIHDDIIDQSIIKDGKQTVYGRFGKETALLAGDFLLLKGITLLYEGSQALSQKRIQATKNLLLQAVLEVASAELREVAFRGNLNVTPEEYFGIIEAKATIAKACMRIGAMLGDGNPQEIDALGSYGRILGILMKIRDDFIDMFEPDELENRFKNECLPLPILYAFQSSKPKSKIMSILKKARLSEQDAYKIVEIILATKGFEALKKRVDDLLEEGLSSLGCLDKQTISLLQLIFRAATEDLLPASKPKIL
jgi:geranylgeranyl pyrophosphate synthase